MCPRDCAAAMSTAPGAEAYFRRGSLFWFTVITLSFGYYTVKAARGVMALIQGPPLQARAGRAGADTAPAGPEPRERGLDPGRRRRVGPPAPFAGAGDPEKPATQAFPVWGGHGSPPDDSVSQDGGGEVGGLQGCYRLLPYSQTLARAGHRPGAGIFRGEASDGAE